MISIRNLSFSYSKKSKEIIRGINLDISDGDLMVLLGPNGVGKSTFLGCLCRLLKYKGEIKLNNKDIRLFSEKEFAKRIAYVPQILNSSHRFSVRDFVVMGRNPYLKNLELPKQSDYAIADKFLEQLDIGAMKDKLLCNLSGGERQKVYIARALAQGSKILVFDEPTSALDFNNQYKFLALIKNLSRQGYTVIMSTHNPNHPFALNSKVGIFCPNGDFISGNNDDHHVIESIQEVYDLSVEIIRPNSLGTTVCILKNLGDN